MLTAKLRPIAINEDPGAKDLAQWMGGLKKTYAVQIETKNQLGSGLVFLAPEQPIANLVSFAAAISRHSGVRELILRAGSPGLGSLEFEMEPNP